MPYFINMITGLPYPPETPSELFVIPAWQQSLMTSILSAGTFFGAIIAGKQNAGEAREHLIGQVISPISLDDELQSSVAASSLALALFCRLHQPESI